jgi:hypothetical protein
MASATRGPLPAGVYWRRRALVASLPLVLVFGLWRVLAGGSDAQDVAQDPQRTAAQAAATPSATPASTKPSKPQKSKKPKATPTVVPLAEPTGICSSRDVLVTPTVPAPVAGSDVTIVLNLQMGTTEACTWRVSPQTMTLKITSGPDDIWSSRECPSAIVTRDVVIRRVQATAVPVTWSSRRSDEYCTQRTAWALPGFYHVAAAALGGEPTDVQFKLLAPRPAVVTETAEPTKAPGKGTGKKNKNKPAN